MFSKLVFQKANQNYVTNVYGFARTFLAIGLLLTLLANDIDDLFLNVFAKNIQINCTGIASGSLYCLLGDENILLGKWISTIVLVLVISGYKPRYTVILHWWISFSYISSAAVIDGGDQISTILTFLLIPFGLADGRKFHWHQENKKISSETTNLFLNVIWNIIRLQVAVVYFFAAVEKFKVNEWVNGTSLYYWLTHNVHGMPDWLSIMTYPLLTSPVLLPMMTWSIIILELVLAGGLFIEKKYWKYLFIFGVVFHIGIALFLGLISFLFAMLGALTLYYTPLNKWVSVNKITRLWTIDSNTLATE